MAITQSSYTKIQLKHLKNVLIRQMPKHLTPRMKCGGICTYNI